ncbi:S-adenosyl-L-methionine-dependent methyltransferase [Rhizophagus diaphanus]|nr:S-adenosyl-L-methionine-dependent methyltransferase [Rhizophagus diaphanus] [Rhizophagus sp. MUCL 43196]
MGNKNSHIKNKRSSIKKLPEIEKIESEQERQEKLLDYYLSTDTGSIDRLHMYHFLKGYIFQGNFSSPIEDKIIEGGCKVLDIGCGPGTWLLDLSNKYENSYFFGVDIKPIFPREIKPKNLEFIEADVTNGLSFRDNEFDFTHADLMSLMFTPEQWDIVLSELIRVTKPGGYIEISDRRNDFVGVGPIYRRLTDSSNYIHYF